MSNPLYLPGKSISDLTRPQLEDIVHRIQATLWYDDGWDPAKEWNVGMFDTIAETLCNCDLIPMEVEEEPPPDPVLFKQFQATGHDAPDLGAVLKDEMLDGHGGRIYCDSLFIEKTSTWRWDIRAIGGAWYTFIGNQEYQSDNLEEVERILFKFALSEGYLDNR